MTLLEARDVRKTYGNRSVLDGVSLTLDPGSILAVLGPSGAGKSTLLRLLHGLETPDGGEVRIDGDPMPREGDPWRRTLRRIGLVQQKPGLLRASALENVAFPLRTRGVPAAAARREAARALDAVGLAVRAHARPDTLSGGETQRVALARALASRPEILLIDEGTNQLDPHSVRRAEGLLRDRARAGAAVAFVTHNVPLAFRLADRFLFLEEGRLIEAGTRTDLDRPRTEALRFFLETGT